MCITDKITTFADEYGELAEWFKALAWKACILQKGIKGSNPLLSAQNVCDQS